MTQHVNSCKVVSNLGISMAALVYTHVPQNGVATQQYFIDSRERFCKICYRYVFPLRNVSKIRIYVWKERGICWFAVSTHLRDGRDKMKSAIVLTPSGLLNTS